MKGGGQNESTTCKKRTELYFEKLIFANALGNNRSRRIKEKTGARLVRIEPEEFVNPDYNQREVWELTKQEWHKLQG